MALSHISDRRYFIKANSAEIRIVWNGERYDGCNFESFKSSFEPNITQQSVLGSNVTVPIEGSGAFAFEGTLNRASSRVALAAYELIKNNTATRFDMEVYTHDANSYFGTQVIIYKGCTLSKYELDNVGAGDDLSKLDFPGQASDILIPQVFKDAKINGLTLF